MRTIAADAGTLLPKSEARPRFWDAKSLLRESRRSSMAEVCASPGNNIIILSGEIYGSSF